ncbi:MAG: gfo/Idh/MocA family oxidoreductase [Planctomycetota bacterium]|nr:MAG: gfo/Idh/MocA family oxidoreductase [Planctomycetota bacterium]REJ93598.1 MAG: gfo/Idh/MocA family oxidoreductase [Planctomycetota bacterium]REK19942.1 MAG: gfo/Idh/MocA family oxidoreductase [Planctomycetota bacterium]REK27507.1 MAG: gfo/Idh/MocA family oxidoreductase [Planctomycetota bacterium]
MAKRYRVGVIGATGRGDFGHAIDTAFTDVANAGVVAVADADEAGRRAAMERTGAMEGFADYREMLDRVHPDIVCIGPRWTTDRQDMVEAVAGHGAHIYCEKPLTGDLETADAIRDAVEMQGVRLQMAHQWRAMRPVQQAIQDVRDGKYGRLLRMRARPKDDRRGGGEELLVHGTHLFDMMIAFAGPPQWVSAHVSVDGRDARAEDATQATEPVGPILGDSISAMFGFGDGVRGFFDSTAGLSPGPERRFSELYGLSLECEQASLMLRQPGDVFVYPAPRVLPDIEDLAWDKQVIPDWHFDADGNARPLRKEWLRLGNGVLANDLITAIEEDRDPLSPITHGVWITEMVQGVYASHLSGGVRLGIPLAERRHPLAESS